MEKKVYPISVITTLIIIFALGSISAINLQVSSKPVSDTYISEFKEPAVFEFTITNLGESDNFKVYSLVGVDFTPEEFFAISSGETKTLSFNLVPQKYLQTYRKGYFVFEYIIKNSKDEIQKEKLIIHIADIKNSISVNAADINPESNSVELTIKNNVMRDFKDLNLKITSPFFEVEQTFNLKSMESQQISVPINKEKQKVLEAGEYKIQVEIKTEGKTDNIGSKIRFNEQENIKTTESTTGFIIRDYSVDKENIGNVKKTVAVNAKKNIISYLFTTFDEQPAETRISGFAVNYAWEKELSPGENLAVTVSTNWFYPLIILIMIIGAVFFTIKYIEENVSLRKNVSYVKTKGGEFALKVTIRIKAKKPLENVRIIDHLPHLVQLYEKYGAIAPDNVNLKERKLEWNFPSLVTGEEKIVSYIIYSKVGVVGKFELPKTHASFELAGKNKTMFSNKAVYVNEITA